MKVFIENESGTKIKNLFDEKRLQFKRSISVAKAYPYPYGFIIGTTNEDGDNIDAFILTREKLKTGEIVNVEVIGLMEQFEKSWAIDKETEEIDHNIIVKLKNDETFEYNDEVKSDLRQFVLHVFDNISLNKTRVGEFRDKETAMEFIRSKMD